MFEDKIENGTGEQEERNEPHTTDLSKLPFLLNKIQVFFGTGTIAQK